MQDLWLKTVAFELSLNLVTTAISLFALLFSWRALSISRHALVADHRSWLTIREIEVMNVSDDWSHFGIKFENIGKSPAQFHVDVRLSGRFSGRFPDDAYAIPEDKSQIMTLAPGQQLAVERWPAWEDRGIPPPHLYVWVLYKDALSHKWHRTEAMYCIGSKKTGTGVQSLNFDCLGNAKGEALLVNQRMI